MGKLMNSEYLPTSSFSLSSSEYSCASSLEVDVDLAPAVEGLAGVLGDGERAVRLGLPDPLLRVVVVLRAHLHESARGTPVETNRIVR